MKTIAVKYFRFTSRGERDRPDLACRTKEQSDADHKIPAIQPLVSFLSPFISKLSLTGIYFALAGTSVPSTLD